MLSHCYQGAVPYPSPLTTENKQILRSQPFTCSAYLKYTSVVKNTNAKSIKVAAPQQQCSGVL